MDMISQTSIYALNLIFTLPYFPNLACKWTQIQAVGEAAVDSTWSSHDDRIGHGVFNQYIGITIRDLEKKSSNALQVFHLKSDE